MGICKNATRLITRLHRNGWLIIALEQDNRADCYTKLRLTHHQYAKTALILGAERKGVSPRLISHADRIIEIPMRGAKESLNVSVAVG
ncbi:MAG: TrmH family RNA methyltransferase [bacterium]|nr:TrmH family RNA methyltransferase [bacterium]MDZ4299652.1 TrmH family RNA methyltransferase [Candidatus Sungbacteria bacterium]